MEQVAGVVRHVREQLGRIIIGQEQLITQVLATILCNGHALIEGVPGLAKTLTVRRLAAVLGVDFKRVQCTSDLMPADIVGTNVFDGATTSFRVHQGPIFTDLLLVDEINRMPPRTQAALLEAMEERQVTIDGTSFPLPAHFTVFATQNPVEFEGTYPLPEAQLDRFLMRIEVDYPDLDSELRILMEHSGSGHHLHPEKLDPVPSGWIDEARKLVDQVIVEPAIFDYVARVVRKTRAWPAISLGGSPRAAISVLRVARALAAIEERDFVIPDDVKAAVMCTLGHRIILNPEAELEGVTAEGALQQVLKTVEVPK